MVLIRIEIINHLLLHVICSQTHLGTCSAADGEMSAQNSTTHFQLATSWLCRSYAFSAMSSVLWRCWLGGRKGIRPVKNWVMGCWCGYVWNEVQTCIWPSGCHCHSLSFASEISRLVLPFWYWLTRVVPDRGPLNGCVCIIAMCSFSNLICLLLSRILLYLLCLLLSQSSTYLSCNHTPHNYYTMTKLKIS